MSKQINIGGRLHSTEVGNVSVGANEVYDDTKGKKQNVINAEVDAELLRLDQSKQNNLTFDNAPTENSNNPVKSGGVYAADKALSDAIEAILLLIPSAASELNKLVDTAMMNSSISTATATFRGTYNVVTDLELAYDATQDQIAAKLGQLVSTADNNDYVYVLIPVSATSTDIRRVDRYKFNGTVWGYEYTLNNSGFTAAQWAAINSAITSALVEKLIALPNAAELATALLGKQDVLTFDNVPTTGSSNPVKSGGVKSAIDDEKTARENADGLLSNAIGDINGVIPSAATSSNKLVDNAAMTSAIGAVIGQLDATFNITSADGHVTLQVTQVDGVITSVQLTTSDIASAAALNLKASQADLTALTGRVATAEGDIETLTALYNALQQSAPQVIEPTDTWPVANPSSTVIYRVIDRVNTPPEYYSDYMWNGASMVLMATYNNAIDTTPKKGSVNLITSGGVFNNIGAFDVSEYHKSGGTLATYVDLSAALASIPSDYQKGGMSIKFVQSSDNKYVQYRLMADEWSTNVANWQGVDDKPTPASRNLVESGGVAKMVNQEKYILDNVVIVQHAKSKALISTELTVKNSDVFTLSSSGNGVYAANVKVNDSTLSGNISNSNPSREFTANTDGVLSLYYGSSTVEQDITITITKKDNVLAELEALDNKIDEEIDDIKEDFIDGVLPVVSITPTATNGYYYNTSGELVQDGNAYYTDIDIAQYAGKDISLEISLSSAASGSGRCTLLIDTNGNVLEYVKEQSYVLDGGVYKTLFKSIPADAKWLKISYKGAGAATTVNVSLYKTIVQEDKDKVVYIDPISGNDTNTGTSNNPFKTISHAVETGFKNIVLKDGLYDEMKIILPDSTNIMALNTGKAIFLPSSHIISEEDGTLDDGVYSLPITSAMPSSLNSVTFIYQYGVDDLQTEILDSFRLPIHGERQYRCDFTAIERKTSLADVKASSTPAFFVDTDNDLLYYTRTSPVSSSKPLFTPSQSDWLFGIDGRAKIQGIKAYGLHLPLVNAQKVELTDCSVFAVSGVAGGYIFDDAKEIICRRCEVARVNGAIGNNGGDGFNGHTTNGNVTNITLDDCWAHDCWNDGCSMHEDVYIIINGGCYEYNCIGGVGAGITPAAGIKTVIKDALCQCNHEGDGVKYSANTYGDYASVECFNVVSRNNENGFYISNVTGNVTMTLINCVSYGNKKWGYNSQKIATCINCKSVNNPSGDYNGCTVI